MTLAKIMIVILLMLGISVLLIKAYAPIPPTVAHRIPFAPATKVAPYTPARKIEFLHGYD